MAKAKKAAAVAVVVAPKKGKTVSVKTSIKKKPAAKKKK